MRMGFLGRALRLLLGLAIVGGALAIALPRAYHAVFPAVAGDGGTEDDRSLAERMAEVNAAVARGLADVGVAPEQVREVQEAPIDREGVRFRPTVLEVQLPEGARREAVEGAIRGELEALEPAPRLYFTEPDAVTYGVRVSLGKYPTHRVVLHPVLPEHPEVDRARPPLIALVVTGVGARSAAVEAAIARDLPLTLAVRPFEPWSVRYSRDASRASKEVLVEVPLSSPPSAPPPAPDGADAGGAVPSAAQSDLAARVRQAMEVVPYAAGVVVVGEEERLADAAACQALVDAASPLGLPILASPPPSSPLRTLARARALRVEAPAAVLDPALGPEALGRQAVRARNLAVRRGRAVVSVPATDAALEAMDGFLKAIEGKGYRFAFASEVARMADPSGTGSPLSSP